MLKFLNFNQKNSLKKLETILNVRKSRQQNQSAIVKKILYNVKKNGDKAVIKYEKNFQISKINPKSFNFQRMKLIVFQKLLIKN